MGTRPRGMADVLKVNVGHPSRLALGAIFAIWAAGSAVLTLGIAPRPVVVSHWANGHMMDSDGLFPAFARAFTEQGHKTDSGHKIEVQVVRANSGEIDGELKSRIAYGSPIDASKADPVIVTPAADHWVIDLNHELGRQVLDLSSAEAPAMTYIGIVTSREMARCLGWPEQQIGIQDIVELTSDPEGWSKHDCARPDWGKEATLAFTYPSRSSTARSVLYTIYALAARKAPEQLTLDDVTNVASTNYVHRFQTAIDCYVPDTLDLNIKLLTPPPCAQFFFIAEDNLVKLYQGKISVEGGGATRSLERDMVMIYPKEGAIIHSHSAFIVHADFVTNDQADAARQWIAFLLEETQQRAFMQEGFRRTTPGPCIAPLGSPFSPCTTTPATVIFPDRIDPAVADAILRAWD